MKIAIILLAVAAVAELVWIYILNGAVGGIYDRLIEVGNEDKEFWKEAKREMSKIHSFASDNADDIKKLRRRLKETGEGTKEIAKNIERLELRTDKKFDVLKGKMEDLEKKQQEFDELADESVRARIDSEKAWAEGVRAIANFGAEVPHLNTKGLENE